MKVGGSEIFQAEAQSLSWMEEVPSFFNLIFSRYIELICLNDISMGKIGFPQYGEDWT